MSHRIRPIIFNGPMIRAILDGRKSQTRRGVRQQPESEIRGDILGQPQWYLDGNPEQVIRCPYGVRGQRLWCREAWCVFCVFDQPGGTKAGELSPTCRIRYKADGAFNTPPGDTYWRDGKWRPSIHMPRWASRITLEITDVRVERVQDISKNDAEAEGVVLSPDTLWPGINTIDKQYEQFPLLWDDINQSRGYSWASNPWCWCLTFRRLGK